MTEFAAMSRHVSSKLAEMDLSVRMRREGNEDAWKFVMTTDVGQEHGSDSRPVRQTCGEQHHTHGTGPVTDQANTATLPDRRRHHGAAGLLAFHMYLLQTRALLKSGEREKESLQRERDQLDLQVRERTANLAELATHLQNVREDERGILPANCTTSWVPCLRLQSSMWRG